MIRRASPKDVPRLVELWIEMWDFHYRNDERFAPSPLASTSMRHWIEGHLENPMSTVFVSEEKGEIVGYLLVTIMENMPIVLNPAFGFISEIAVTEKARRRGIGEQLVREAHAWLKSRLITSVEVNVSALNAVSKAFWRKMGYRDFLHRLQCPIP